MNLGNEDQPGLSHEGFKVKFESPAFRDNTYPVITYSIRKRTSVYKTFGFWETLWRRITKQETKIFEGYHYRADVVLCKEALSYFQLMTVVQIRQKQWLVESKNSYCIEVRSVEITRQLAPIQIGDSVIKLYSAYAEGQS